MHRASSKHPNVKKETISTTKMQDKNVRVTRSRAKALGVSISPSKPAFKQEPSRVPRANNKQMASDYTKVCNHKRLAVLKDMTNTLAESEICKVAIFLCFVCIFVSGVFI